MINNYKYYLPFEVVYKRDTMAKVEYDMVLERDIPDVDILVAGFPGLGLIGGIASEQLINTLDLEQVASLHCDEFPPTAVIFNGIPRRPVRIFGSDNFMLIKSDMIIPSHLASSLASWLVDWSKDNHIDEIIIFDGILGSESEEKKVWGVLSAHSVESEARKFHVDVIDRGAISGISSSILLEAHEKKLKALGLFAEGNPELPDARASANLLNKFSDYTGITIETETLIESARHLENEYIKLIQQTKIAHGAMEHQTAHPPLYG